MIACVLGFAAAGAVLSGGSIVVLWMLHPTGALKVVVGLPLLIAAPPYTLLAKLLPGLLHHPLRFVAVTAVLNGLLYAGVGAWTWSSRGRPAAIRLAVIGVPWIAWAIYALSSA